MQYFNDPDTGAYWALDDDVAVIETDNGRLFRAADGSELPGVPPSLVPVDVIPEPVPDVPVPVSVSRWQGREAMRLTPYGDPEDGVSLFDAAVALLNRPDTPAYYLRAWDELQDFEFDSPMLVAVADELGLTYDDRVALFLFAASLRA
ncbi:MAG: hypothetical protein ACN6OP_00510 [Pseudomonadales bacterium]